LVTLKKSINYELVCVWGGGRPCFNLNPFYTSSRTK